jgi:hypothetical protein
MALNLLEDSGRPAVVITIGGRRRQVALCGSGQGLILIQANEQ